MSIAAATLRVDVDMNTGAAERQLSSFGQKLNGFAAGAARAGSAMFTGLAMGAGIALFSGIVEGAGNAVASIGGAVKAASDLSETINKVTMILGDSAPAILKWSETTATSIGMGQNTALNAAASFGMFGKQAQLTGEDLAKFSTDFVKLAADMASFNNTTPEDAIFALSAALRGESEPLRRYAVLLDEMTLRQTALEMGIVSTTKQALTPQQRVLAASAEIMRQTAVQQGDYARTSGGLANQQRNLTASVEKLSLTVGNALLPVMVEWTKMSNTFINAILPSLADLISIYLVPPLTDLAKKISEVSLRFGEFMTTVELGGDPIGAFIEAFDLQPWAEQVNDAITWFAWLENEWSFTIDQMKWSINEWAIGFATGGNQIISAINTIIGALVELDRKQRIVAGGMALITGNAGAAYTLLTSQPSSGFALPMMPVSPSQVQPVRGTFSANTIATSGWGGGGPPGGEGWGVGSAARAASDAAAAAAANRLTSGLGSSYDALGGLTAAADGASKATSELESALRGVPGLFGTSAVTAGDMAKAAAGMPVNFADDYVRQVGDELLNGVDLANIDPAEVAASLNMDPSVPAQLIYDELVRQWGSGEYFANPENIAKINWTAVQAKLDQDAKAVLGQSNILAAAIAQGITIESMAPVASATVSGMTGALAVSDMGTATATATIAAINTPEAIAGFSTAGENAFNSWRGGWETAWENWSPPPPAGSPPGTPPAPPGTPMVENPTVTPIPITIVPAGSTSSTPGGRSGSGYVFNITINGAGVGRPEDFKRAAASGVLEALRARGRV